MSAKNYLTKFKSGIIIIILAFLFSGATAQPWNELLPQNKVEQGTLTIFDYQKAFNDYWEPFGVENGYYFKDGVKNKAGGWKQFKRWEHFMEPRVYPSGYLPATALWNEYEKIQNTKMCQ